MDTLHPHAPYTAKSTLHPQHYRRCNYDYASFKQMSYGDNLMFSPYYARYLYRFYNINGHIHNNFHRMYVIGMQQSP